MNSRVSGISHFYTNMPQVCWFQPIKCEDLNGDPPINLVTVQCSAGNTFGPGLHVDAPSHAPPIQTLLHTKYTSACQLHSPMALTAQAPEFLTSFLDPLKSYCTITGFLICFHCFRAQTKTAFNDVKLQKTVAYIFHSSDISYKKRAATNHHFHC